MDKKPKRKQPDWEYTLKRRNSMAKAQRTHVMLVRIGKKYRNEAIRRAKRGSIVK